MELNNKERQKKKIIPFFIPHVGCPHICVFCNQRRITGVQELPTATEIEKRISEYTGNYSERIDWEVAFYGGSFSAIPRELQQALLEPAYKALKRGDIAGIRCSTRPDAVENDELDFLQSYGVNTIELGVQSMDDAILQKSKRGHTAAQVEAGAHRIQAKKMKLGIQLMPGLPGETWQSLIKTAVLTTKLNPQIARVYPVLVIKDTELADMYAADEYEPLTVEKAIQYSTFLKSWLEQHGVQVIRTGLQATEDFDKGVGLIAGPYEPAMGERVIGRQWRWRIEQALQEYSQAFEILPKTMHSLITDLVPANLSPVNSIEIIVSYPRRLTSKIRGVRQENVNYFKETYPFYTWVWQENKNVRACQVEMQVSSSQAVVNYIL